MSSRVRPIAPNTCNRFNRPARFGQMRLLLNQCFPTMHAMACSWRFSIPFRVGTRFRRKHPKGQCALPASRPIIARRQSPNNHLNRPFPISPRDACSRTFLKRRLNHRENVFPKPCEKARSQEDRESQLEVWCLMVIAWNSFMANRR